jgi:predicted nucleic acid-binding protein
VSTPFLDSNILLCHLTNEDPRKASECLVLFRSIEEGHATVWTSDLVIAEVVFVLSNRHTYNVSRETIRSCGISDEKIDWVLGGTAANVYRLSG